MKDGKTVYPLGTETKWILCPNCGAKHSLYSNVAECHDVFLKCTRGCKREFELVIKDGQQLNPETGEIVLPTPAK